MVRIKYKVDSEDRVRYHATEWFTVGPNVIIQAVIESCPDQGISFSIGDHGGRQLYCEEVSSLRAAKSQVRKKLIEFGLVLEEEIRS